MRRGFTVLLAILGVCLFSGSLLAQASYDTLTIHDLQYVADPVTNDDSPYLGDTVVVGGMVMHGPRDLWIGARWATYIIDPDSFPNPWSGFFIVQNDTSQTNLNYQFVEAGTYCYFTGVIEEYNHFSQMNIYGAGYTPNPPIPVTIVSTGNPIPDPVTLTISELADRATAEQWEEMWARIENATVVNNQISGNWASITDPTGGLSYLSEYFNWFYTRLPASYQWPSNGTNINVNGFTQDVSGGPGQVYTINPRDTFDIEILTNPPMISDASRDPGVPTSSDDVTVSATIVDNGTVQSATLNYSVDWAPFQQMPMTAVADTFSAAIPAQADGNFVRYFFTATDNNGESSIFPGDTSMASGNVYFYVVRDGGLSIKDVQYTYGYNSDISGYEGYEVTLQGVVMTDSTDFVGDYYIQEDDTAWSGIWVNDGTFTHVKGDWIEVTGEIEENYNVTRVNNVTSSVVTSAGFGEFDPVPATTGAMATTMGEPYESVLIEVDNLTVSNPFPDAPGNYGEFSVDDGSGELRVDDFASAFSGNLDSTYALGDHINAIIAEGYYSFSNYKILPRDTMDIIGHTSGIEDGKDLVAMDFELDQNYPNPFNPSTEIRYNVAKAGDYSLVIYNVLGQKVRSLANRHHTAGQYKVLWNGMDDFGSRVGSGIYFYRLSGKNVNLTKKMILLK